jgi:hypothetical protein
MKQRLQQMKQLLQGTKPRFLQFYKYFIKSTDWLSGAANSDVPTINRESEFVATVC